MERKQVQSGPDRLPFGVVFTGPDEKANLELKRLLTMGRGEDGLRVAVRRADVKVTEHLIRLVRRDPVIARKVAVCLLGHFGGLRAMGCADRVTVCLSETDAEARENPLEAKYLAGRCDSAEKAELADAITAHIAALESLRDCLAADLYAAKDRARLLGRADAE